MIEINKVTRLTNIEYGLYYMQQVEKLNVHFGGHTSLRLCFGFPFAVMRPSRFDLYYGKDTTISNWFKKEEWKHTLPYWIEDLKMLYFQTDFLPRGVGIIEDKFASVPVNISGLERGLLEALYVLPEHEFFISLCEMMEDLILRPEVLQPLLEGCTSNKVKRMFFYMAEKWERDFLKELDLTKISYGTELIGDYVDERDKEGPIVLNKKYNLRVPDACEDMGAVIERERNKRHEALWKSVG